MQLLLVIRFLPCVRFIEVADDGLAGTVTGSIGVASMRPKLDQEFLDKLGVTTDEIMMSEGAHSMSLFGELSDGQIARVEKSMDDTYAIFKKRVALGRKMSMEQVDQVARGRVFSGEQALEIGLIDEFGASQVCLKG
jgi:protease-4